MPNQAGHRRSRSHIETDDEADEARYGGKSSSPASEGAKRMRLRGGRRSIESAIDDEEDDEFHSFANTEEVPRTNGAPTTNGVSRGEFQPGAIVRVMVENFVTYEHAEFYPGPNLNMVIGPNGTGKSSLVCAICLGLGYHSNVLGRASSFGEFVKHGKDTAIVEVELQKRRRDRANYVIRLRINREDNSRKFWVNGRESTQKAIQGLMRDLRIQIDNLCQFLPQDKVAEFAGLNAVDLLTKTLQAAAPREMIETQNTLKTIYAEQKEAQHQAESDKEHLRGLEMRQQGQQADVERLREREEIQVMIKNLQDARVLVEYQEAGKRHHDAKERKKEAQRRLRRLEEEAGPSLEAVNRKQEYQAQIQAVVEDRKKALRDAEHAANRIVGSIEEIDDKIKDLDNKKESEHGLMATKKQELGAARKKIASLENAHKKETKEFNPAEWNRKIREQEHLLRDNEGELRQNEVDQSNIKEQGRAKQNEVRQIEQDMAALNSQEGQKLNHLRRNAPDVAKGWDWLQEHKDEFEKEVFGPPMLSCSVKDERYSNHIQAILQREDFLCFTTQSPQDHKKLSQKFYKELGLAVAIRTCTAPLDSFRPPLSQERLAELDFDGLALDYLDGPEPVLAMLCSEKKIHMAAVSLKETSDETFDKILQGEAISSFATGSTFYRITRRREYGPGASSTRTTKIGPGQYWTDQPVDTAEKAELERRLVENQRDIEELKHALAELRQKNTELADTEREIKSKIEELKKAKNELQREYNQWLALPDKIENEKKTLQSKVASFKEARQRMADYEDSVDELILEKARLVLEHKDQLAVIRAAHEALLEAQVRLIEARSDLVALKERNQDIVRTLEEEGRVVTELTRELDQLKQSALRALHRAQDLLDGDEDRKAELLSLARDQDVQAIDEEIGAEKAKLELIHAADPGVLRDFENRAVEIERLQRRQAERQRDLDAQHERIQQLREEWEPQLDELVSRINDAFSYNFEQISCAGEVGVHKDEDFERWAIEIRVKFRENETLQKLDQHRQSGGERAVSTIFYLMSLQSMAQAPFRVVDEINQGMDPRNERMVHERMVEIACREHTSQYFLITPKLLSGLRYDERMRVLCIASGEHMPEQGTKLDFSRCVKIQRRRMAAVGA
ncbi:Structural maintenance of chromosomes protein 5 [Pleurostoma richardsiae]|uniref:Structural maintenance of chromosomes protein 5 n=1 Tax=Pleurostoma richardsiae TaxID=41990 RepID=A0AA38S923_9PEZI|nr:Structural maintenance of chromosomes protein 5 [Pleurostoma richardsiae]